MSTSTGYINTSVQKGFLSRMNGTIEHTQTLCEILTQQRRNKNQYCLAQFDLKNAFGSLSHDVIHDSLNWIRAPTVIRSYDASLYDNSSLQVCCSEGLSKPIPVGRGILQGDTLSPTLFNPCIEFALSYVRASCPRYGVKWDDGTVFQKAYADDITFLTNTPQEMQQAVHALTTALSRLGLTLNIGKCRVQHMSVATGSGYMTRRPQIMAKGTPIPHICDKGSMFLGMTLAPGAQQGKITFQS